MGVLSTPDRLVTTAEVLDDVGTQFRNVLYRVTRELPREGRNARSTYERNGRTVGFWTPTYSSHLIYKALAEHVSKPAGSTRRNELAGKPVTTAEIAHSLRDRGRINHSIPVSGPLDYPASDLPIEPYTLGAWLGDGHSDSARITCIDSEILDAIREDGYVITRHSGRFLYGISEKTDGSPWHAVTRRHLGAAAQVGLVRDKHVPELYLRASIKQRRALLAGLLDTDGHCDRGGAVELAVTNERLARGALELIHGLGYKATLHTKPCQGRSESTSVVYRIVFRPHDPVFRLTRKRERQTEIRANSPR